MSDIETINELSRRLRLLERRTFSNYRGAQAGDFDTTTLPHHGDYGFQTTDNEVQMNCNGTIRAVAMAAL